MKRPMAAPPISPNLRLHPWLLVTVFVSALTMAGLAQDRRFLTDWNRQAEFFLSNDAKFGNFRITPEYELSLGNSAQINVTPANDPEAQQFVQQLVTQILGASPAAVSPVTVSVYQESQVNAVTVPGRMFLSFGLLREVRNEGELTALVSHELGHLYSHHASRRLVKAARGKAMLSFLSASLLAGKVSPNAQGLATLAGNLGLDLYLKAYDRSEEFESDRYATHLLFNAGFSPLALGSTLTRMSELFGATLFTTHPALRERLKDLASYVAEFPQRAAAPDSPAFTRAIKKQTPVIRADVPPPASALPPVVAPPASALPPVKRPPGSLQFR